MSEKTMDNVRAVMALNDMKVYSSSRSLDAINYAVAVLKKLEEAGIKHPLESLQQEK